MEKTLEDIKTTGADQEKDKWHILRATKIGEEGISYCGKRVKAKLNSVPIDEICNECKYKANYK